MIPFEVTRGTSPVVLGFPHVGTCVPKAVEGQLVDSAKQLADTDWHVDRLYAGLLADLTRVRANFHRYVIDANRDPGGASLYPGQNTTSLVPLTDFDGRALWHHPPGDEDIQSRLTRYHSQYHNALNMELQRVRSIHGVAILYDCHSIRSQIPFLFDGILSDFNIGDNEGRSCDPRITHAIARICKAAPGYRTVANGRFKGGWTTRHYGHPNEGIHAIQMELAQSTYLKSEMAPFEYCTTKAARLRITLAKVLEGITEIAATVKEAA